MAGNGRYVAFASHASNLVSGDTNDTADIFVFDMQTNALERVNVTSNGQQTVGHLVNNNPAPYDSNDSVLSDDGRFVAFTTPVVAGKHNVVLFDRGTESNETSPGWAEAAADALLARQGLVYPANAAANGNIHFVAHSFGAALTSDVIERLAAYGVTVDHLTYLDPHDFDETAIPVDESQHEFDIGLPQTFNGGMPHGIAAHSIKKLTVKDPGRRLHRNQPGAGDRHGSPH